MSEQDRKVAELLEAGRELAGDDVVDAAKNFLGVDGIDTTTPADHSVADEMLAELRAEVIEMGDELKERMVQIAALEDALREAPRPFDPESRPGAMWLQAYHDWWMMARRRALNPTGDE